MIILMTFIWVFSLFALLKSVDLFRFRKQFRLIAVFALLFFTLLLGASGFFASQMLAQGLSHQTINDQRNGASVYFASLPSTTYPVECITVRWEVSGIREVYLNDEGVVGSGERNLCGIFRQPAILSVHFLDETRENFSLFIPTPLGPQTVLPFAFLCAIAFVALYAKVTRQYRDVVWLMVLLIITSVPLVILRFIDASWGVTFPNQQPGILLIWLGALLSVAISWHISTQRTRANHHKMGGQLHLPFLILIGFCVVLAASYALPARLHFWIGLDEVYTLRDSRTDLLWASTYDMIQGRPLVISYAGLAGLLSTNSLHIYLWIATFARLFGALALFSILQSLLQNSKNRFFIAVVAAILYLVNPVDEARFTVLFANGYFFAPPLLLLALLCWIRSYLLNHRLLLCIALVLLAYPILMTEASFPLAAVFGLAIFWLPARKERWSWIMAWYGVITLLTLRLIFFLFYTATTSYQLGSSTLSQNQDGQQLASQAFTVLTTEFGAIFNFLKITQPETLSFALIVALVVGILLYLSSYKINLARFKRTALILVGIGVFTTVIGILPFLISTSVIAFPRFRSHFFSMTGHSILLVGILTFVASLISVRFQRPMLISTVTIIATLATLNSWSFQERGGVVNTGVQLETVNVILRQIEQDVLASPADAILFFDLEDDAPSPFGWDHHLNALSCYVFGRVAYQGQYRREDIAWHRIFPDSTHPLTRLQIPDDRRLLVFSIDGNQHVSRLDLPVPPLSRGGSDEGLLNCVDLEQQANGLDIIRWPR
jgi:hypothetical protein